MEKSYSGFGVRRRSFATATVFAFCPTDKENEFLMRLHHQGPGRPYVLRMADLQQGIAFRATKVPPPSITKLVYNRGMLLSQTKYYQISETSKLVSSLDFGNVICHTKSLINQLFVYHHFLHSDLTNVPNMSKLYPYLYNWWLQYSTKTSSNFALYWVTSIVRSSFSGWVCAFTEERVAMDKGKGKLSFADMVKNEATKNSTTNINDAYQQNKGNTNSPNLPNLIPPCGSTKSTKSKVTKSGNKTFDPKALFNKLALARTQAKKKKELTILGFLVGDCIEFPRLFAKLRVEWRTAKGDISFSILKAGWFEINFSNHVDFNRVWNARPYHIFSQLLLLKQWHSGFEPSQESISQLDLWVRLHFLPEEFANAEALTAIIEENSVGTFLKMDPTHNSNRMNMFTRFCINTDVSCNVGKRVIIPDELCNPIKYKLWFDDFPNGCGACGLHGHEFEACPNRAIPVPTLRITIKKSASTVSNDDEPGWNSVGKNNKNEGQNSNPASNQKSNLFYGKSGVNFIYESDDSDELVQSSPDHDCDGPDHSNVIPALDDTNAKPIEEEAVHESNSHDQGLHKYAAHPITSDNIEAQDNGDDLTAGELENMLSIFPPEQSHNYILNSNMPAETDLPTEVLMEMLNNTMGKTNVEPQLEDPPTREASEDMVIDCTEITPEDTIEPINNEEDELYYEEYEEDMIEEDNEIIILEDEANTLQTTSTHVMSSTGNPNATTMICTEPPFSVEDLDNFLNNSNEGNHDNKMELSTSTSSKRKSAEGMEDTASSCARGGKKSKN